MVQSGECGWGRGVGVCGGVHNDGEGLATGDQSRKLTSSETNTKQRESKLEVAQGFKLSKLGSVMEFLQDSLPKERLSNLPKLYQLRTRFSNTWAYRGQFSLTIRSTPLSDMQKQLVTTG